MARPPVSVVVPSLGRPGELDRCLAGLSKLLYRPYEVVVVACDEGRAAIARHLGQPHVRSVRNDGTGVSAARNAGIEASGGEIIAFIDDDAVPEPTWLDHLVSAMEETRAAAATGFVRGRNGISFQWRGRTIRPDGFIDPLPDRGEAARVPGRDEGALMLEGANMAFRRDALLRLGGFDPAFRFYMDDADISLRVRDAGLAAALVPLAQVHHGFAPSRLRRRDRMPLDLYDNGRSLAIFLRRHIGPDGMAPALAAHREGERRRVLRYMVTGHCEPRDVRTLLSRFDHGARDGTRDDVPAPPGIRPGGGPSIFREDDVPRTRVLAGRAWSRAGLRRAARDAADRGEVVSLFRFGPTSLYHHVRFDPAGYWEQTGGLFGRADRSEPLVRLRSFRRRLAEEVHRVAKVRGISESRA
jgi:GT2 family glycosyltransferase